MAAATAKVLKIAQSVTMDTIWRKENAKVCILVSVHDLRQGPGIIAGWHKILNVIPLTDLEN